MLNIALKTRVKAMEKENKPDTVSYWYIAYKNFTAANNKKTQVVYVNPLSTT